MAASMLNKIEYIILLVAAFASRSNVTEAQAYRYLSQYGALALCDKHYGIMHTLSLEENIDTLQAYCQRKGGELWTYRRQNATPHFAPLGQRIPEHEGGDCKGSHCPPDGQKIAQGCGLYTKMSEKQLKFLDLIKPMNIEARYQEIKDEVARTLNR